jgi:hypothetical protein
MAPDFLLILSLATELERGHYLGSLMRLKLDHIQRALQIWWQQVPQQLQRLSVLGPSRLSEGILKLSSMSKMWSNKEL